MTKLSEYEQLGKVYRKQLFEKFLATKQGHPGSVFSMMDIAVVLYHGGFVRFDSNKKVFTDRVVISKGHATASLYPILKILESSQKKSGKIGGTVLQYLGCLEIPLCQVLMLHLAL